MTIAGAYRFGGDRLRCETAGIKAVKMILAPNKGKGITTDAVARGFENRHARRSSNGRVNGIAAFF